MTEHLLAGVTEEFLSISWLQSAHEIACQSMFLTRTRDTLLIHGWKNGFKQSVAEMAVTEMDELEDESSCNFDGAKSTSLSDPRDEGGELCLFLLAQPRTRMRRSVISR
ncbi:hypothetical protein KCU81_g349, partial [Aureobasidium melanogenum]